MNAEVATLVAYRPADGQRMRTNSILNDLAAELRAARVEFPVRDRRTATDREQLAIAGVKSDLRLRDMQLAVSRAAERLEKVGAE